MATEHFTDVELECRCLCGTLPPQDFQDTLQRFRIAWGNPMRISSGARCPEHNARVSSTGRSGPHTIGAVDVLVSGQAAYELVRRAIAWGWTGIGIHQRGPHGQRFVHLDMLDHPRPRIWTY